MSNLFSRIAMRVAYGVGQLPRVAWYVGHSLAVRRLADAARLPEHPLICAPWPLGRRSGPRKWGPVETVRPLS